MCDEWMPTIEMAMSLAEFEQLPRNAAYKYEFWDGKARLSPNPKTMHATLDLTTYAIPHDQLPPANEYVISAASRDLHMELAELFADAFGQTQPFASLPEGTRLVAAEESLRRAFAGEEGPWLENASFVSRRREGGTLVGAILLTLIPQGDPSEFSTYRWHDPPTGDAMLNAQPHITWIFTHPFFKGDGIGTSLLVSAVRSLRAAGYRRLLTTFIAGNDSSMLWHWRNGFQLAPYFASKRRFRRNVNAGSIPAEAADFESDHR